MQYAALLRGVNVGGANKVDMKELKAAFEAAGADSVRTYINSGNVLFHSAEGDAPTLARTLERAVAARFGLDIAVLLLDLDAMRSIAGAIPADWSNGDTMKCDVLFLWPDVDRPSILDELPARTGIDTVLYTPGAVVRSVARKDAASSGLTRIVGTPLYRRMTMRNCNTARKLLALMEESAEA